MKMSRCDQFRGLGQQHAVAEHVAAHVADAHGGEGLGLDVLAHFAEVALDRLPGPARGDSHGLVVVTDRATRGEGVAQPEAVVGGYAIGDVGEGRRTFVGRHDQIGVVVLPGHDAVRADHRPVGPDGVGDVQQARQEGLIGPDGLGLDRVAVAAAGEAFGIKSALGPDRHNDGVLDLLGLHQPQHLGAEIVAAVGPTQAAPRYRAEAQMHALDMGGPDEDLAVRLGQRQIFQLA